MIQNSDPKLTKLERADPDNINTPSSIEHSRAVPATPVAVSNVPAPIARAEAETPGAASDKLAEAGSLESWPTQDLIALLDSAREETRAFRSHMYGSLTAAILLIPAATITLQDADFLKLGHHAVAISVLLSWLAGATLSVIGLLRLSPRPWASWGRSSEAGIMDKIDSALEGPPHANLLIDCIREQHGIFKNAGAASRLFGLSMLFFIACAAVELIGFLYTHW